MSNPSEAPAELKICKNCKFYNLEAGSLYSTAVHKCLSPHNGTNMITGELMGSHASLERTSRSEKHCGVEARFYQEIEVKDPPPASRKTSKARP